MRSRPLASVPIRITARSQMMDSSNITASTPESELVAYDSHHAISEQTSASSSGLTRLQVELQADVVAASTPHTVPENNET